MNDVLGQAIADFYNQQLCSKLWIHNKYGRKEEMPVTTYFRSAEEMPELELIALQHCTGRVLDIGAGAGSHTLELQDKGVDVTALEISEKAAAVMEQRGVKNIVKQDIFLFEGERSDTLLLLMNGIGLTGNLARLREFLQLAKKLVVQSGIILLDSSDVAYLYNDHIPQMDHYYGEIKYRYEYKKQKTEWFTWLYIDQNTLAKIAGEEGWELEILWVDEYDQYLAKLTRSLKRQQTKMHD
ncbi:MAG: class I SAM-dependent methyltransferase [Bacteroidota bacterium]|nr:class I SAM-dependent methyltransferase [Bacteroidota bacterium]